MKVDVKSCARCGEDHDDLEFSEFTNPPRFAETTYTHYATCPTRFSEPILLAIVEEPR